jgi:hypothetical protein
MNDAKADRIDLITRIIMEASIIVAIALLCHVTGQRGYQRGYLKGYKEGHYVGYGQGYADMGTFSLATVSNIVDELKENK